VAKIPILEALCVHLWGRDFFVIALVFRITHFLKSLAPLQEIVECVELKKL
jgi:hypothetical protein